MLAVVTLSSNLLSSMPYCVPEAQAPEATMQSETSCTMLHVPLTLRLNLNLGGLSLRVHCCALQMYSLAFPAFRDAVQHWTLGFAAQLRQVRVMIVSRA